MVSGSKDLCKMTKTFDESMLIKMILWMDPHLCFYSVLLGFLHKQPVSSPNWLTWFSFSLLWFFPRIESYRFLPMGWLFLFVPSSPICPTKPRPNISLPPDFLASAHLSSEIKASCFGLSLHHVYFLLQPRFSVLYLWISIWFLSPLLDQTLPDTHNHIRSPFMPWWNWKQKIAKTVEQAHMKWIEMTMMTMMMKGLLSVPTVLRSLYSLFHWMHPVNLCNSYSHYPCLADYKTEAQRCKKKKNLTQSLID